MSQLRVWMTKYEIPPYNEQTGDGLLRHIVLRCSQKGDMTLILVINGDEIPHQKQLLALFNLVLPKVKSIVLNHNKENTNVILGSRNTVIYGLGYYIETICGLDFKIGPDTFLQVNPYQTEALYNNLFKMLDITKNHTVIDLFCGVGTITLNAAKRAAFAYGVEISETSVKNAEFSAKLNDIENVAFIAANAYNMPEELKKLNGGQLIVTLDPPRKGLTKELIAEIAALNPEKIGYVSCDPATLARDLAEFKSFGYSPQTVQPVDMFPQTVHIETVVLMSRNEG